MFPRPRQALGKLYDYLDTKRKTSLENRLLLAQERALGRRVDFAQRQGTTQLANEGSQVTVETLVYFLSTFTRVSTKGLRAPSEWEHEDQRKILPHTRSRASALMDKSLSFKMAKSLSTKLNARPSSVPSLLQSMQSIREGDGDAEDTHGIQHTPTELFKIGSTSTSSSVHGSLSLEDRELLNFSQPELNHLCRKIFFEVDAPSCLDLAGPDNDQALAEQRLLTLISLLAQGHHQNP